MSDDPVQQEWDAMRARAAELVQFMDMHGFLREFLSVKQEHLLERKIAALLRVTLHTERIALKRAVITNPAIPAATAVDFLDVLLQREAGLLDVRYDPRLDSYPQRTPVSNDDGALLPGAYVVPADPAILLRVISVDADGDEHYYLCSDGTSWHYQLLDHPTDADFQALVRIE